MITVGYMETKFDYENTHKEVIKSGDVTLMQQMVLKWKGLLSSAKVLHYDKDGKEISEKNDTGKIFTLGYDITEVNNKISELNKLING